MHNLTVFAEEKPRIYTLDGGTGSELERLGATMSNECWCGLAGWENPKILEDVHRSYIDAGAQIIIVNTFATSPIALATSLDPETIHQVNQDACKIGMKVKYEAPRPVAVAGSISHMIPYFDWNGKKICGTTPEHITEEVYIAGIQQQVAIFEENNLDVIFIEEQYEADRTEWDLKACVNSDLPIFLGIACKDVDG
jgi:S-methylmethionine-dependent homocysteine/selenocysteine methylase